MLNLSNLAHAALALLCQIVVVGILLCFGESSFTASLIGGALATGFYWGREVAQHERKAGTPPWYSGFKFQDWSLDSKMDFLCPLAANILVCLAMGIFT